VYGSNVTRVDYAGGTFIKNGPRTWVEPDAARRPRLSIHRDGSVGAGGEAIRSLSQGAHQLEHRRKGHSVGAERQASDEALGYRAGGRRRGTAAWATTARATRTCARPAKTHTPATTGTDHQGHRLRGGLQARQGSLQAPCRARRTPRLPASDEAGPDNWVPVAAPKPAKVKCGKGKTRVEGRVRVETGRGDILRPRLPPRRA
jgi:hypothetical protein